MNGTSDSRRPSVLQAKSTSTRALVQNASQVSFDTAALAHSRSSELNPDEMNALTADGQKSEYSKTMYI